MSKYLRRGQKGFTLIELMIVVAIIGILAAIAIPNFLRFQLRARSSEGKTNIAAIRTSEESYAAEFGEYLSAQIAPAATNIVTTEGPKKAAFTSNDGYTGLGWAPEGRVYFIYAVASTSGVNYTVDALANIDGDATNQLWGYVKPSSAGASVDGVQGCILASNTALPALAATTVGPCSLGSGASIF